MLEFAERTIVVRIDTAACGACETKACVSACGTYSRGILRLSDGVPSVAHLAPSEVVRKGTECLACEHACRVRGREALSIEVPIEGLEEHLAAQRMVPAQDGLGGKEVSDGHPD